MVDDYILPWNSLEVPGAWITQPMRDSTCDLIVNNFTILSPIKCLGK